MDTPSNKKQAQERIDRIHAFRNELASLSEEGIFNLSSKAKETISHYHSHLIAKFSNQFDTDSSDTEKKMSLGMRILTFLGGLALCASIFFFFYQIWGHISTSLQIIILILTPILSLVLMNWAARVEKTLYYASLLALLAFVCFVLNLHVLGQIFNIAPSQNAFLIWGLFGIFLAYYLGLKLLLVAGLLCILGYISATVGVWSGLYWLSFGERPENFIIAGFMILLVPIIFKHRSFYDFPWIYYLVGLLSIFISVLILSNWGGGSYLLFDSSNIEIFYQTFGFIISAIVAGLGIRFKQNGVTNIGVTFFTIFLYTKFFDWWWDLFPKYLFFLIISGITIGLLAIFKTLRKNLKEVG